MRSGSVTANPVWENIGVFARWALGALFVYMGLSKAMDPVDFLKLVRQYDLVTTPFLLNAIAGALPWFEVFCGLLLMFGIAVRGSAVMLVLMLVPFTILVLKRALFIAQSQHLPFTAVKFDCGCGAGEVYIWKKMIENTALFLLSCWMITGAGKKLSARYALFGNAPANPNREFLSVPPGVRT